MTTIEPLNEADTRAKLIDPAIHKCGWTEDHIKREETAGTVEIIAGKARRRSRGKIDYVLRLKLNLDTQPVALALLEAKKHAATRSRPRSGKRVRRMPSPERQIRFLLERPPIR